ncbi:MAG: leucine-rich repeat domain-containing protein [Verrucomicrobiales bacterium]
MKLHTEDDVRHEALLSGSRPPELRLVPPSLRRWWAQAMAMLHGALSNGLRTVKTNPSATLRAFWFGLLLVCCSLPLRAEQFELFTYVVVDDSRVTITDYPDNATGHVEIPLDITGKPIVVIQNNAFSGCTGVTSVTIPGSLATIGYHAFQGCTGLTKLTIAWGVTAIGAGAFSGCTGLTSVIIPSSVTSISSHAFSRCTELASVTISPSVTSIGNDVPDGELTYYLPAFSG